MFSCTSSERSNAGLNSIALVYERDHSSRFQRKKVLERFVEVFGQRLDFLYQTVEVVNQQSRKEVS